MARIRTIKPEFWEDEGIGILSREARLLFLCCLNVADDEGILRWSAAFLKSQAFIYDDDISVKIVESLMEELTESSLIFPYRSGKMNQVFGFIVNFQKHQKINRPTPSKLPPPSLQDLSVREMYAKRDGWHCHLCGGEICKGPDAEHSGDFSLSIDHVIPQSQGGEDYPSNLRVAHITCNKGRCNRSVDDYKSLIRQGKAVAQLRWGEKHPQFTASLTEDSMREGKGMEGKGMDQEDPRLL